MPIARPLFEELAVLDNNDGNKASTELNAIKKIVKVIKNNWKLNEAFKKINWLIIKRRMHSNKMYFVFLNFSEMIISGSIPRKDRKIAGR